MPIYEFYCNSCHMIFNFYSGSINTEKRPDCPRCKKTVLERRMSIFSTLRRGDQEEDDMGPLGDLDEAKLEQAMTVLAKEAENINEDDPRQAAQLMRKLSDMTGIDLGPGFQEAINRMEAGEDPDQIEAELGDALDGENPFEMKKRGGSLLKKILPPRVDETLYDL